MYDVRAGKNMCVFVLYNIYVAVAVSSADDIDSTTTEKSFCLTSLTRSATAVHQHQHQ